MRAPKHTAKNPGMGQVEAAVREAAERWNSDGAQPQDTAPQESPREQAVQERQSVAVRQAQPVAKPIGLVAMLQQVPWWGWALMVGGGLALTYYLSDDEDESEKTDANVAEKNAGGTDGDGEDEGEDESEPADGGDEEDGHDEAASVVPAQVRRAHSRAPFRRPTNRVKRMSRRESSDGTEAHEGEEE